MEVDADAIGFRGRVGGLGFGEVRAIESRPFALRAVPPDVFLPLGPRFSLRVSRGPIVEHAPVAGPAEAPFRADPPVALHALAGHVLTLLRIDPGVDPDAARRRAVVLERGEIGQ